MRNTKIDDQMVESPIGTEEENLELFEQAPPGVDNAKDSAVGARINKQRFIYQFISAETGDRSQPFVGTWDKLYKAIQENDEENAVRDEDYILVVATLGDKDQIQIPGTPLLTKATFMKWMAFSESEVANSGE